MAARFAADSLGPRSRRVIVKTRLVRVRGGNAAQAQGVVMFGKPNHQVMLVLQGNQLAFQATSSAGSCSDNLRSQ